MKLAPGMRSLMASRMVPRAEQKRLLAAARVQQAIREDVAALGIGGELNLVDGQEVDVDVARHRLDGRDPVARALRLDLFFAGDERDLVGADAGGDLVVDLACEQPQRQADHAALVTEHALDREMGLAGVGRAENGGHVANARFEITRHTRNLHYRRPWHCIAGKRDQAFRFKDLRTFGWRGPDEGGASAPRPLGSGLKTAKTGTANWT
jgi:hypothetical protein